LLITLGLVGLYLCYGGQAGQMAKLALGIGVLGGVAGVFSNLLMIRGYEYGWLVMNISMVFMFAGLFVFGLVALWKKTMPQGLPALAGFWWPLIVIQAYVFLR
jgi:hypothetical protein